VVTSPVAGARLIRPGDVTRDHVGHVARKAAAEFAELSGSLAVTDQDFADRFVVCHFEIEAVTAFFEGMTEWIMPEIMHEGGGKRLITAGILGDILSRSRSSTA